MPINLKDPRNRDYVSSLFCEYLQREHRSDLIRLATQPAHVHLSLVVHFNYLCEFDNLFSELLLIRPLDTLLLLDEGLRAALKLNCIESDKSTTHNPFLNVHTRLTALPVIPEVHRETIPWSSDVGKFIALRGTVSRVGPIQVLQGRIMYTCSKCGFQFYVDANFESHFSIKPPRFCPNRELPCGSPNLKPSPDRAFYAKNYQEVWIHERFRCLTVGVMPRSISASFEDDLLETVKPGDDVVINGIVTRRWQPPRDGVPCSILLWIKVNYVENLSELKTGVNASHVPSERVAEFESFWSKHNTFTDALESRNILLRSLCPEVCGMYLVKLSLALLLAGAPEWSCSTLEGNPDHLDLKPRIRGSPHILLIGDPGTAKSVLLRVATDISHRAVLTAATGTTAAGLTATAVRDANGWSLDAGALVLADGGLCAIDEFTALHGAHRSAVHEAMEQQTISLAKAGLVTRLNCRCSVLAAANPPPFTGGRTDEFGLPTPLLSRFDIIWRLVDPLNSTCWDRKIANFVLKLDRTKSIRAKSKLKLWSTDRLREYFSWVRQEFKPQLSNSAANLLQRYYTWRRKYLAENDVYSQSTLHGRSTLRLLESLVRLTKAHARLMARSEAGIEDAVVVIAMIDASLQSTAADGASPGITGFSSGLSAPEAIVFSDIPVDSKREYIEWSQSIQDALVKIDAKEVITCHEIEENDDSNNSTCGREIEFGINEYDEENSPWNAGTVSSTLSSVPLLASTQKTPLSRINALGAEPIESLSFPHHWPSPPRRKPLLPIKSTNQWTYLSKCTSADAEPDKISSTFTPKHASITESKTDWQQRVSAKLSKFSSSSSIAIQDDAVEPTGLSIGHDELERCVIKPEQPGCPRTFDFASCLPFDVQLTDEDFEIDL